MMMTTINLFVPVADTIYSSVPDAQTRSLMQCNVKIMYKLAGGWFGLYYLYYLTGL